MSSLSTDNSSVWGAKGQAEVRLRSNPKGPGKTIARGNWDPEAVHWGGMLPRTEECIVHQELKLNPPDPPVLEGLGRFRVCSGRWQRGREMGDRGCDQFLLEAADIIIPPLSWPGDLQDIPSMLLRRDAPIKRSRLRHSLHERHTLTCSNMSMGSDVPSGHQTLLTQRSMLATETSRDMIKHATTCPDTQGRLQHIHTYSSMLGGDRGSRLPVPAPSRWIDGAWREGCYKLNIETRSEHQTAIHPLAGSLPGGCGTTGWGRGQGKSSSLN